VPAQQAQARKWPFCAIPLVGLVLIRAFRYASQLGKGRINKPFIVKARFVSKLAEQKIKEAGGVVKIVA
jgi:large subunit ribosomal protein L27Ae